jgi:DNA mismatch repair protein MSH6
VKKTVNYTESESDDDDVVLKPSSGNLLQRRPSKRQRLSLEDSDDEFGIDEDTEAAMAEAGRRY